MPVLFPLLLFSLRLVFWKIILAEEGWWRVRLEVGHQFRNYDNIVDNPKKTVYITPSLFL